MSQYAGEFEDVLRPFFDAMRYKLSTNKHKGRRNWEETSVDELMARLEGEVAELKEAIVGGNTIEMLLEAADVGNYAMMLATVSIALAAGGTGSDPKKKASKRRKK